MNKIERKKIQNRANRKLLFFTFLGAFILFFTAFTYILPIIVPNVDEPAMTDEYAMDSVTSQDFRGRIDPRLHSLENQEEAPPAQILENKDSSETTDNKEDEQLSETSTDSNANEETDSTDSDEEKLTQMENRITQKQEINIKKQEIALNAPPRPKSIELRNKIKMSPPVPVYQAKVIVGDFSNPKEVKIASDILVSLNYEPYLIERNGKYSLQIGSFSDSAAALDAVNELKNRNFDAKIIYE